MDKDEKRLDIALEATKQQITLSSGIIAAIVLIHTSGGNVSAVSPRTIHLFAVSVLLGVIVLLAAPRAVRKSDKPLDEWYMKLLGFGQALCFLVGLGSFVLQFT